MENKKTIIIAEAGVNHNGDLSVAKKLIEVAASSGADYVKFQTFNSAKLASSKAGLADYQKNNLGNKAQDNQQEMLKKLELSHEDHFVLMEYARQKGIQFFSTGFDLDSIRFLKTLNLGLWKIPSGEITNLPYLELIASYGEPVIISTGMSYLSDVQSAVNVFLKKGIKKEQLTVLHCNTEYPTPLSDVNLNAMVKMGKDLGIQFGYSDHTLGIEVPVAAVALGASVIEKHFTLSRNLEGPDHKASLEPQELKEMMRLIRNIEISKGSDVKEPTASEIKNRDIARKSIAALKNIKKGEIFSAENLTTLRPGSGISPMKWYEVIGTVAKRDFAAYELIE